MTNNKKRLCKICAGTGIISCSIDSTNKRKPNFCNCQTGKYIEDIFRYQSEVYEGDIKSLQVELSHANAKIERLLDDCVKFENLKGQTIIKIDGAAKGSNEIIFTTAIGERFKMYHEQECCETVSVEDICGEIETLINSPILIAKEKKVSEELEYVSTTATFYELATIKGSVTIRWYGESNGYYSETVDFVQM